MLKTKPPAEEFTRVPLEDLRPGMLLRMAMYDGDHPRQPLLLAAGVTLTPQTVDAMIRRGVKNVKVHTSEVSRLLNPGSKSAAIAPSASEPGRSPRSAGLSSRVKGGTASRANDTPRSSGSDSKSSSPTPATWKITTTSFLNQIQSRPDPRPLPQLERQFQGEFEQSLGKMDGIFTALGQGVQLDSIAVHRVTHKQLELISKDLDLTVAISTQPVQDNYPSQHALQTAMLASSMGTLMGLKIEELRELCQGCLLHDAGMLKVAEKLRSTKSLGMDLQLEMKRHPIYIFDMLDGNPGISHAAKMVAYQMHERMDGSGYPRQRSGTQIHPLARIAAVADTYIALVSPRPQRKGYAPYEAVKLILEQTQQGQYDASAVRALLHSVSLFPVGSVVELNDGRSGRVLRSNREQYDRPIVEILGHSSHGNELIDLAKLTQFQVVKAATDIQAVWQARS